MTQIVPLSKSSLEGETHVDPAFTEAMRGCVITIGNFDGVHLGHAALLRRVRSEADRLKGPAVAVVLDPHPASILRPERAPKRLTWIERRADLMDQYGIDTLVVCRTSRELLGLTAEAFFESLVQRRLQARAMVEGPNFFFGRNRGGDIGTLEQLCTGAGIELTIVEPREVAGEMVSSTRIRGLLSDGRVERAAELLGTPYRIRGTVVTGAKRGRQIGFPTANLDQIDVLVPGPGVYGGFVTQQGQRHIAAIHIGPNPTFELDGGLKVEVHVLDYDGDLYGSELQVDLAIRVRDIARFDNVELLVEQLHQDIELIRARLARTQGA